MPHDTLHYYAHLPFWDQYRFTVDCHLSGEDGGIFNTVVDEMNPASTKERATAIVGLMISTAQEALAEGNIVIAYFRLFVAFLFVRRNQEHLGELAQPLKEQVRALDFVIAFMASHPDGAKQILAEHHVFTQDVTPRFKDVIREPDRFTDEEVVEAFSLRPVVRTGNKAAAVLERATRH